MKATFTTKERGMTLVEMLVAVAITVVLLAIIGAVFSHASRATGLAVASNEIMASSRTLTRQLKNDLRGLRPDMPMAIIFEPYQIDPDIAITGDEYWVRRDRIVFFANGDFQVKDYATNDTIAANMARIFYGQTEDVLRLPPDASAPPRRVLTRRFKVISQNCGTWADDGLYGLAYAQTDAVCYDYLPFDEWQTLGTWKNMPFDPYYLSNYFRSERNAVSSMVRRPVMNNVAYAAADQTGSFDRVQQDAIQRLYFLPDVEDFTIEVWFKGATDWFPNPNALYFYNTAASTDQIAYPNQPFAFFWNVKDSPAAPASNIPVLDVDNPGTTVDCLWYSEAHSDVAAFWPEFWPKALRFTFTLYDKNRSSFPKGRTFSYIVELPPRER